MRTALAVVLASALTVAGQSTFTPSAASGGGGGGEGTVTSVALTAPAQLSVSGSPITGSGTLGLTWASATQNRVFAAPNGIDGTPLFRLLVAADLPASITSNTSGNAATATALAANPSDCTAPSFARTVAANGDLGCANIASSDLPASISANTSGNAATATALAANPADCSAPNFARTINAAGDLGCAGIVATDLPGTITSNTSGSAATATALAANPTDCSAGSFASSIDASGNLTCAEPSSVSERWVSFTAVTTDAVTSMVGIGQNTPGGQGTATSVVDATGQYINMATTAVLDNFANNRTTGLFQFQQRPDVTLVMKTGLDITNIRYWIGLGSGGTSISGDDPTAYPSVAFTYSTAADGTAFWRYYSNDATGGGTRAATAVAITTDTRYVFRIVVDSVSSVRLFINGTLVGTVSTDLPPATTTMGYYSQVTTLEAASKSIRNGKSYVSRY